MTDAPRSLSSIKRLVVKIGSALLVEDASGEIHRDWLDSVADDIAAIKATGTDVVVVTSGASAVGRRFLNVPEGVLRLEEKQASAATGDALKKNALTSVI